MVSPASQRLAMLAVKLKVIGVKRGLALETRLEIDPALHGRVALALAPLPLHLIDARPYALKCRHHGETELFLGLQEPLHFVAAEAVAVLNVAARNIAGGNVAGLAAREIQDGAALACGWWRHIYDAPRMRSRMPMTRPP